MEVQRRMRKASGTAAKRHGKEFEMMLEQWFSLQSAQGSWVDIRKQNEALKPIRPVGKGQFLAVYTAPSGCDYFGTIMGGTTLVIEAKHREGDRISQSDLTPTEKEHLSATGRLGGYAMLMVGFADGKVFLFPYAVLDGSKLLYGHKHIKESELIRDGYEVEMGRNLYDAIRSHARRGLTALLEAAERQRTAPV